MRSLIHALARLLAWEVAPDRHAQLLGTEFLARWLDRHLAGRVDSGRVLPAFTANFEVQVLMLTEAGGSAPVGPLEDRDGNPTPVLHVYQHGDGRFVPLFNPAPRARSPLGPLGSGPRVVTARTRIEPQLSDLMSRIDGLILLAELEPGMLGPEEVADRRAAVGQLRGDWERLSAAVSPQADEAIIDQLADLLARATELHGELLALSPPGPEAPGPEAPGPEAPGPEAPAPTGDALIWPHLEIVIGDLLGLPNRVGVIVNPTNPTMLRRRRCSRGNLSGGRASPGRRDHRYLPAAAGDRKPDRAGASPAHRSTGPERPLHSARASAELCRPRAAGPWPAADGLPKRGEPGRPYPGRPLRADAS